MGDGDISFFWEQCQKGGKYGHPLLVLLCVPQIICLPPIPEFWIFLYFFKFIDVQGSDYISSLLSGVESLRKTVKPDVD